MKIFVINLDRHPERLVSIRQQLQEFGMDHERIRAVDGGTLSQQQLDEIYDPALVRRTLGRDLARGEIGCAMSHLSVYRKMAEQSIPVACILEDDAHLTQVLPSILHSLTQFMASANPMVCLLTHVGRYTEWGYSSLAVNDYKVCKIVHAFCTHGYVINLEGAKALLKHNHQIKHPIDYWNDLSWNKIITVRAVVPYVIGHSSFAQHSEIETDRMALSQEEWLPTTTKLWNQLKIRFYDKLIYQLIKPFLRIKKQPQTF